MQTPTRPKTFPRPLVFCLVLLSAWIFSASVAHAASTCPGYSTQCSVIGGMACGVIGPDCAGVSSKMNGGKMMPYDCTWTGDGYDNCVCACPYVDKCADRSPCPAAKCNGDLAASKPQCNSDTGECVYGQETACPGGCNSVTGQCVTCEKDIDCPGECADGVTKPGVCTNGNCELGAPQKCKCGCARGYNDISTVCNPDSACAGATPPAPKCQGKATCPDKCEKATGRGYSVLKTSGECDEETGGCTYQEMNCPNGCSENEKGVFCLEECDNGIDDDGNGKIDCADTTVCQDSLYCSCKMVSAKDGNGRKLQVLVGGYDYDLPSPANTAKARDEDALKDASMVFNSLSSTYPFSKYGLEVWVTRLPGGITGPWRSDLLAKCPGAKADVTVFVSSVSMRSSNSRFYSMNADLYKRSTANLPRTLVHELGHGIGGLWDEYSIKKEIGYLANGASRIRDNLILKPMTNCCWLPTDDGCRTFYGRLNIAYQFSYGCAMGNWYKTSEESVMSAETVNQGKEYNSAGKYFVDKALRNLLIGPDPPDDPAYSPLESPPMPGYDPTNPQLEG